MEKNDGFQAISSGDRRAFDVLVEKYQEALVSFAYGILGDFDEALDIVQDVFVDIWLKRSKIEFGDGIGSFLYLTTRYYSYNKLRSAKRLDTILAAIKREEAPDPMDSMVEHEVVRILYETIDRLPPRTAEVMRLSLQGLKQEEIGAMLGMAVASVKTLKYAGIKKLKDILKQLLILLLA